MDACVAVGIREYVVCAGARNLGVVAALAGIAGDGEVRVFSHFEERAAGFFALGRCVRSGAPCAVVTTSGTAVAEGGVRRQACEVPWLGGAAGD